MPALMLIVSRWYTQSEQASRHALWYCGLGAGQLVGGLLSYGFQHATNSTLQSWRMMFLVLGSTTTLLGIVTLRLLPDSPSTATFLSDTEKATIRQHLSSGWRHESHTKFNPKQLLEQLADTFKDPQIGLLSCMTILVRGPQDNKFFTGAILLTIIPAEHFVRRDNLLLGYIDSKRWLFAEGRRTPQHSIWCGVDRNHSYRWVWRSQNLVSLSLVYRIMRHGHSRRCTDELLAYRQQSRSPHGNLSGQFRCPNCHGRISANYCEHCWARQTGI